LKLKQEKAEVKMLDEISKLVESYTDKATFEAKLQSITESYFDETKANFPKELSDIQNNSADKTAMEAIVNNWKAQLKANVRNLHMQLQLLDNTT
jgi:Zn-dependent M16 (insulinase) family peptidase